MSTAVKRDPKKWEAAKAKAKAKKKTAAGKKATPRAGATRKRTVKPKAAPTKR